MQRSEIQFVYPNPPVGGSKLIFFTPLPDGKAGFRVGVKKFEMTKSLRNKEYDIGRSAELENWELKIIRFTNDEIFENLDNVVAKIQKEIVQREVELKQSKKG